MKKHKNMAKKNMKLNEEGVGDFKDIPGFQRKTTQVTDPVGYLICSKRMLDYVKRKGFNPNLSGNGIIGKGLYFIESNLYPNLDSFRRYGDSAIKVRANGTFNAYQSNYFGENVFLVPPEQFDSIEILDMIEPGKIQQQKDDMYANYGNRSIGGGAKDMDDFYDLNIPGSLSMQAMEEPDDYVGSLYRDNGQNPRWASPKGDFSTKRISESQLRNMIAENIKKVLKESNAGDDGYYSYQYLDKDRGDKANNMFMHQRRVNGSNPHEKDRMNKAYRYNMDGKDHAFDKRKFEGKQILLKAFPGLEDEIERFINIKDGTGYIWDGSENPSREEIEAYKNDFKDYILMLYKNLNGKNG